MGRLVLMEDDEGRRGFTPFWLCPPASGKKTVGKRSDRNHVQRPLKIASRDSFPLRASVATDIECHMCL